LMNFDYGLGVKTRGKKSLGFGFWDG